MARRKTKSERDSYEPTEAEIRKACQEIQDAWTVKERKKRSYVVENPWMPPIMLPGNLSMPDEEHA